MKALNVSVHETESKDEIDNSIYYLILIERGKTEALCDAGAEDIWNRRAEIQSKGRYICMIVLPDEFVIPENIMDL